MTRVGSSQAVISLSLLSILAIALCTAWHLQTVKAARSATLYEDQRVIQSAVQSYTEDQGHPPASLDDLVRSGYLKAKLGEPPTQF